jgi:propionyl-CoA carboxylase alpha chain
MAIYQVNVGGKEYQVEIEDVSTQPVRAVVNGREVQVWVGGRESQVASAKPDSTPAVMAPLPEATTFNPGTGDEQEIRAPMPGSIVSVAVQPGDRVEVGQDLCILEAMKMNNRLRAPRVGTIARVHVSAGQQVQHDDLLVTFAD